MLTAGRPMPPAELRELRRSRNSTLHVRLPVLTGSAQLHSYQVPAFVLALEWRLVCPDPSRHSEGRASRDSMPAPDSLSRQAALSGPGRAGAESGYARADRLWRVTVSTEGEDKRMPEDSDRAAAIHLGSRITASLTSEGQAVCAHEPNNTPTDECCCTRIPAQVKPGAAPSL